ncbi:MAG: hypothetical protein CO128_04045 [Ignavibacteriales bacterium CG_4_9_14_3_um_filter_30_11]|nr:MAG: hypothetical protein CO128_04045 [Ignavibacteriales bacterium CG_4_9_14_3_um_filter_30_11]
MFLVIGTFLLSAGLVMVFKQIIFKRMPKPVGYFVLFITAGILFLTRTVHGIWLGLTILVIVFIWLKYFVKRKIKQQKE